MAHEIEKKHLAHPKNKAHPEGTTTVHQKIQVPKLKWMYWTLEGYFGDGDFLT